MFILTTSGSDMTQAAMAPTFASIIAGNMDTLQEAEECGRFDLTSV